MAEPDHVRAAFEEIREVAQRHAEILEDTAQAAGEDLSVSERDRMAHAVESFRNISAGAGLALESL